MGLYSLNGFKISKIAFSVREINLKILVAVRPYPPSFKIKRLYWKL